MRRFLRAFRVAFWSALHGVTSRRCHTLTIEVHADTESARAAIHELEVRVDQLIAKAEYAARAMGRLH